MKESTIHPELKLYVEQKILPQYDHFDAAHQRNHAEEVIARSLALAEHYEVNINMVYAIAAYHDMGLCEGRDTHHLVSGRIIHEDKTLRAGFDEEQIFDLALVVDEAYVNAIEHGANGKKETKLEIKYIIFEDKLEISIKDCGCGFDMNTISVPSNLKSINSTRGRGLGLMKLLTDEFSMESKPGYGTTVRFSKYI